MLILASMSPRRKEILSLLGEDFRIIPTNVDETVDEGLSPEETVKYLSRIKAEPLRNEDDLIIGADTVVALDGKIFGKPKDREDAFNMLTELSGKTHSVFTGVTLINGEKTLTFCEETKVTFYPLTENEINRYLDTNEFCDKAGSYAVQGKGCLLIQKIDGDYFNVVGLPIARLNKERDNI